MNLNYTRSPRAPLTGTQIRDLANSLALDGANGQNIAYADFADVVWLADRHQANATGVNIARERLTEAANGGNDVARGLLADLARAEAGEAA